MSELVLFTSVSFARSNGYGHGSEAYAREVFLNLAVRLDGAWYLIADLDAGLDGSFAAVQLKSVEVRALGKRHRGFVVVRYAVDRSPSNQFEQKSESIFVVGVGPSRRPSVVGPIWLERKDGTYPYGDAETKRFERSRRWRFVGESLVVDGETTNILDGDEQARTRRQRLAEHHLLTFP